MWEREVVQPAAQLYFKTKVTDIEHYGSYNCRRIYGRSEAAWSEHATADAIDVAGFRFANGMRITVRHDWKTDSTAAAFLHTIRDGACSLFSTTLSPDYRSEEHTSELQSLMRISYAVFCLKTKNHALQSPNNEQTNN